jgi:Xaa-Pro aminopeptidase
MLTSEEKEWLNTYHQMVYERLSPALDEVEKEWLKFKTQAI